ncbi:MAG: hypothetical protein WCR51_03535 [Planctomycetia bacterium]
MGQRLASLAPFAAACLPVLLLALPHDWRFTPFHAAAAALVLALAWHAPLVDRQLDSRPRLRWLLMGCAAVAICWLLFGASTSATWGIIDDHEIHAMIGAGRERIPPGELPGIVVGHPEIGSPPFTSTRYRPAYYLLRLGEAAAWGRWSGGWMITRLVLFAFTALLGFDLLRQWLGFVGGGIALALFASLWMWPEIVIQLGPPECYAAPAVVAFAWCAVHILRSGTTAHAATWAGLTLAALVAIGSKENFVILAPLAAVVAGCEWWRGRLTAAAVVACIVVGAAAMWVAFVVGAGIAANGGRDVYQRPVGLAGFARGGEASSGRALRKIAGYGLPLLAGAGGLGIAAWRSRRTQPRLAVIYAVGATLAVTALSQFFFYRGEVFKKCRYDLPFVPLIVILLVGGLVLMSTSRYGGPSVRRARRRLLVPGTLAIAACVLGGDHARAVTQGYASRTQAFFTRLDALATACRTDPERPVVFRIGTDPAATYEATLSVPTYLRSFGITNALFLDPAGVPLPEGAASATWQERDLATAARDGGHRFARWDQLPPERLPIDVRVTTHSPHDGPPPTAFQFP